MAAIPEGLTFEEAAPSSEGSHYARSSIRSAPNDYKQHLLANCTAFAPASCLRRRLRAPRIPVTAYLQTTQLAHWVEPDGAPLPEMT
jgi:hypothetical protein